MGRTAMTWLDGFTRDDNIKGAGGGTFLPANPCGVIHTTDTTNGPAPTGAFRRALAAGDFDDFDVDRGTRARPRKRAAIARPDVHLVHATGTRPGAVSLVPLLVWQPLLIHALTIRTPSRIQP